MLNGEATRSSREAGVVLSSGTILTLSGHDPGEGRHDSVAARHTSLLGLRARHRISGSMGVLRVRICV
jgi:hypothetical protein